MNKLELEEVVFNLTPNDKKYLSPKGERFISGIDKLSIGEISFCFWFVGLFSILELKDKINSLMKKNK